MTISDIPKKYAFYQNKHKANYLAFNPLDFDGLSILNKPTVDFLNLINDKRDLKEILSLVKKENKLTTEKDLFDAIKKLMDANLIYFDLPKLSPPKLNKPKMIEAWLHITNKCNLRCKYCYVNKNQENMTDENIKIALDGLVKTAVENDISEIKVKISGGEALLVFKKVELAINYGKEVAKKFNKNIKFIILTNGILLTEEKCKKIKQMDVRVMVSLDGEEKSNDKVRVFTDGSGSYKYIMEGIKKLQKYNIPFNISITITDENSDGLAKLTKNLINENIVFTYNFYRETCSASPKLSNSSKKLVGNVKKAYKVIETLLPENISFDALLDRVKINRPHLRTCGVGIKYIVIGHMGSLHSCQMTLDKSIGDINESDYLKSISENSFIEPKELTIEDKKTCNKCMWRYVCTGGCPILIKSAYGTYDQRSPLCDIYSELIPELLKLKAAYLLKKD